MWHSIWQWLKQLLSIMNRGNVPAFAAVLAFFAFSSLIPILLLLVMLAIWLVPDPHVASNIGSTLSNYIPDIPDLRQLINLNSERLYRLNKEVRWFSIIGLFWTSVGGFLSLQQTFDMMAGIRRRRSFIKQYLIGFVMMFVLLFLTLLSGIAVQIFQVVGHTLLAPFSWLRWFSFFLFPILLFVTSLLCYRLLPSIPPPWLSASAGALFSTVIIYIARDLFLLYAAHMGQYELIYGALSFIELLAFWFYILSFIFLLGGALMFTISKPKKEGYPSMIPSTFTKKVG